MTFELLKLEYAYDSLEPVIDEQTMKIHHDKHHQAYLDKLNAALKDESALSEKPIEEILSNLEEVSEEVRQAVTNHGGGFFHHSFFWNILKKDSKFEGKIAEVIEKKFESFEKFKEEFSKAALTIFGSGWAWLVLNEEKELEIIQTKDQDSPLSIGKIPLLTIDVWEHAYYLNYQNKRAEWIENFFKIINWEKVNENYLKTIGDKE